KPVGEPDAGDRHVRFDERGWETERCQMAQATAPILDSTFSERSDLSPQSRSKRTLIRSPSPIAIFMSKSARFGGGAQAVQSAASSLRKRRGRSLGLCRLCPVAGSCYFVPNICS